jgi:thiol peroxidase
MKEEKGVITMKGNSLTLLGKTPKVGDRAPDFTVLDNELKPASLSHYKGKVCILS